MCVIFLLTHSDYWIQYLRLNIYNLSKSSKNRFDSNTSEGAQLDENIRSSNIMCCSLLNRKIISLDGLQALSRSKNVQS